MKRIIANTILAAVALGTGSMAGAARQAAKTVPTPTAEEIQVACTMVNEMYGENIRNEQADIVLFLHAQGWSYGDILKVFNCVYQNGPHR